MASPTAELTDEQWRAWAREHKVCYQVHSLMQKYGEQLVQVGFEFEIAARLPKAAARGESRRQTTQRLLSAIAQLAHRVFPAEGEVARFDLAPSEPLAQLRRETGFQPEVRRVIQVYHKEDYWQAVGEGDRQRLGPVEQRLRELGVKAGSW
jgi:hypothetical protein